MRAALEFEYVFGSTFCTFSKLTTTDTYLNATTQLLHELNERKPLALVKG